MDTPKIFESEYRFCLILWENEPIKSPELAGICAEKLGWKNIVCYENDAPLSLQEISAKILKEANVLLNIS